MSIVCKRSRLLVLAACCWLAPASAWSQEPAPKEAVPKEAAPKEAMPVEGAPEYRSLPVNPNKLDPMQTAALKSLKEKIFSGTEPLVGNEQSFDDYYKDLIFPQWTLAKNIENFPTNRQLHKKDLITRLASHPDVHDRLNRVTLKTMGDIAGAKEFNPIARFNAMKLVADLDQIEPALRTRGTPLPEALPVLLRTIGAVDSIPDYVRVAALQGTLRHAESGLPPAQQELVRAVVLPLVQQVKPPANRSAEAHAWMRRRGVEILGALGGLGTGNAVPTTLDKVIREADSPFSLRCAAARALGGLDYKNPVGLKAADLIKDVVKLSSEMTKYEIGEDQPSRQRLKSYVHSLKIGLVGVAAEDPNQPGLTGLQGLAASSAPAAAMAAAAIATFNKIMTVSDDASAKLAQAVQPLVAEIDSTLASAAPPAAKPAAAPGAPGAPGAAPAADF